MNCKNCEQELHEEANFCSSCGAKVVRDRTTLRQLLSDVMRQGFGWDNAYLRTLRALILRPQEPLKLYVEGTRKKYQNPIAFFAIGAAIALLVMNFFADEYLEMNNSVGPVEITEASSPGDTPEESTNRAAEFNQTFQRSVLRYFNIYSFALLPLYTLVAFLVYRKPYNFGEHLLINAYLQGVLFLVLIFTFFIGLLGPAWAYQLSFPLTIVYYSYAYSKLYQHSFGKAMLMLLKFFGVMIVLMLIGSVLIAAPAFIIGLLTKG